MWGERMKKECLIERLECNPIIAAVREDAFDAAIASPVEVIFCLKTNILSIDRCVQAAHEADKMIFVHIDLADGVGRDRAGIAYLEALGVDGVISTRTQLVKQAREAGLLSVQRFFALDSQGLDSIGETLSGNSLDFAEIMPGVIGKTISRFAVGATPIIAGGLIETKKEVLSALEHGAIAVSTGRQELWYL
jgi:glycerol uptake operon antiterminator